MNDKIQALLRMRDAVLHARQFLEANHERLHSIRHPLSQMDVAKAANVSRRTVMRIEAGEIDDLSNSMLARVVQVYSALLEASNGS